jgi:CRISPR/Cas system-associated exonuclease Cas4 (RecB family)
MTENDNSRRTAHCRTSRNTGCYLKDVTAIQAETVRRLIETDSLPPLEMAAVLEDIANKFLDMSDDIREFALSRQEAGLQSPA